MNNEIKEILGYFEEYIKIKDMHDSEPMLNWKDLKIVLDYITNLQQDLDKANEIIIKDRQFNQGRLLDLAKLKEEKERLKERIAYLERSNNRREDTIISLRLELSEQEDYKSRCEKASDNLKRNYWIKEHEHNDDVVNMTLNILQNGGDKE